MTNPHALIYLVANLVPAIIGFFALILYTHLLSPAEYGIYVVGASIAGIIAAFFFTWIRLSVSRYQAMSPELDLRAEATIAYLGTAAVIACLAPLVVLIVRPSVGFGILAGSLFLSLALTTFEISQEFRRARLNPFRFTTIAVIRSVASLTLGYAAIKLGGGGAGLLVAVGASFLLANIFRPRRDASRPRRRCSGAMLMQFVRYGAPFSLGAITIALHNSLDRLGIAYLLGPSAAGYYGFAADMTRQIMLMLGASVASAMFPIAFRSLAEAGPDAARARLAEGGELLFALVAPVTVWLVISADTVAGTLVGSEFQAGVATLLPLLVVGRMCGVVNQFYLQVSFQLAEKPFLQVTHDALVLVLNIVLLFPLTLWFGLPGTAAAVLLAEGLGVLIGIGLSRRAFRLPFNARGLARVAVATLVMGLAVYAAKTAMGGHGGLWVLAGEVCCGGLAYAAAAIMLDVAGVRQMIGSFFNAAPEHDAVPIVRLARNDPAPLRVGPSSVRRNA
jgi:O-antigen/teichoic acid export membrane protein